MFVLIFFFTDSAPTEIYTLSLHDALPISDLHERGQGRPALLAHDLQQAAVAHGQDIEGADGRVRRAQGRDGNPLVDRKSTRLNSSHMSISYAVFCLKKKKHDRSPAYTDVP